MGLGPLRWLEADMIGLLRRAGYRTEATVLEADTPFLHEIQASFALLRQVASTVKAIRSRGAFPLVLAGNCHVSGAVLAGCAPVTDLFWFDAHADFNTPDVSGSGYLDGMALAAATGRCWQALTGTVPGFRPIAEEQVMLIGARDIDPLEDEALRRSSITLVPISAARHGASQGSLQAALTGRHERRQRQSYIHIDMDVLDPREGIANEYAAPDGLSFAELVDVLADIGRHLPIAGASISGYNPNLDPQGRLATRGVELAAHLAHYASGRGS